MYFCVQLILLKDAFWSEILYSKYVCYQGPTYITISQPSHKTLIQGVKVINQGLLAYANADFSYIVLHEELHSQPVRFCSQPDLQTILDGSDFGAKPKDCLLGKLSPCKSNNHASNLVIDYHKLGVTKGTLYLLI